MRRTSRYGKGRDAAWTPAFHSVRRASMGGARLPHPPSVRPSAPPLATASAPGCHRDAIHTINPSACLTSLRPARRDCPGLPNCFGRCPKRSKPGKARHRTRHFCCPGAYAADIVRYRSLLTAEFRFNPEGFRLELASPEPPLLRMKSVARTRPDRSPDLVVIREPLSRGAPRRERSSRSGPG